jgi:hypothetical protein
VVPPRWGASCIDRHDHVFPRERHRVASSWVFIEFHTPGGGSPDHETLHHVTVLELVPDGVCVVWACLFEEPHEVVHKRPHLTLVATFSNHDAPSVGATYLHLVTIILVDRGHGPSKALLSPFLATHDALLSTVDGDVGWRLLAAASGRLPASLGRTKFGRLIAAGVLGGNTM